MPSGPAEGKVAALSPLGRSCCLELQLCRRGCVEGRDGRTRLLVVVPRSCSCAVGAARRGNVAALATWWPCLPRSCSCALSGLRGGRQGGRARHLVVLHCCPGLGAAAAPSWPCSPPEGSRGVAHMRRRQLFKKADGVDHPYGFGHLAEWMDWIGFFFNRSWTRLDMD